MKKLIKFTPILFLTAFMPMIASAACDATGGGLTGTICTISNLFGAILPVLIAFGVLYFTWGIIQYVVAGGEEAKKKGKDSIVYGIIGLAVIVGVWGLVNIVTTTFGLNNVTAPAVTQVTGTIASCTAVTSSSTLKDYLCFIVYLIDGSVIPLIFALAAGMFVWGVLRFFIINADEEAKRAQGKQFMIWGIIALAVMLSFWGLVGILGGTFNLFKLSNGLPHVCPPGATNC